MRNRRFWIIIVIAAVAWAAAPGWSPARGEEGFKPLFNGKDWSGFKPVLATPGADPAKTWRIENGTIICSGRPNGYQATEKIYKNYILRFDWKYTRPADLESDEKFSGNSGCLVHITGEDKVWPKCIEVQGMNKDHGNIFGIGGAKGQFKKDAAAQKKAIRPVGQWNTTEIVSQDGKLSSKVNGVPISEGSSELKEGRIGFQSEGAEIHFRNMMIKELN